MNNNHWERDEHGYWYRYEDGTYPKSKWEVIEGFWYYFDEQGYAVTGWRNIDNQWYYFAEDGKMLHDRWIKHDNKWYYLTDSGAMATDCEIDGWIIDSNGVGTEKVQNNNTPILGEPIVTKEQMLIWAKKKNNNEEYIRVMSLVWEMSVELGIRPDVTCCQVTKETGALYVNGSAAGLDSSYHNPCGLKITQGGGDYESSAHKKFRSWNHGITAYLDHLALYLGLEGYPLEDSLDPRHFPYLKGTVKYVEDLSGKWCPSSNYGNDIVKMIEEIKKF